MEIQNISAILSVFRKLSTIWMVPVKLWYQLVFQEEVNFKSNLRLVTFRRRLTYIILDSVWMKFVIEPSRESFIDGFK